MVGALVRSVVSDFLSASGAMRCSTARRPPVDGCCFCGRARPQCSQATRVFAVAATTFAKHMFQQPRSLEGATGGSWRWSGVRRLRLRALQARGPGGTGTPREHNDSHAIRRYRCRPRPASMLEPRRQRESDPMADQRRAERRKALRSLRQGDAHAARRALKYPKRQSALRPLGLPRGPNPALPRRKHNGQPRGRATPRTISRGCLTT